jgi:cytochrome b561
MTQTTPFPLNKYPLSMRVLHWLRAVLILALIASGWYMTRLTDAEMDTAMFLYPNHKQFGVLVWLLAIVHLSLRWHYKMVMPGMPTALKGWEKVLSHTIHKLIIALTVLIPMMGYSMSSSYSESDGVPFFFIKHIPEILPKNDNVFVVFQALHEYGAYLLLACIFFHVAGAIKHRIEDKNGPTDVLPRML